jgi:hypothetical protein
MSIQYEVMASTGSYTDKNGQEKKRWAKCGVVMSTKTGGLALKMETMPVGGDGWFSLFEPKPKDDFAQAPRKQAASAADMVDDAPF